MRGSPYEPCRIDISVLYGFGGLVIPSHAECMAWLFGLEPESFRMDTLRRNLFDHKIMLSLNLSEQNSPSSDNKNESMIKQVLELE